MPRRSTNGPGPALRPRTRSAVERARHDAGRPPRPELVPEAALSGL